MQNRVEIERQIMLFEGYRALCEARIEHFKGPRCPESIRHQMQKLARAQIELYDHLIDARWHELRQQ